jgi:acyl dehydratase
VIDRALIGKDAPAAEVTIDPASVVEFARAIGETNAVYLDVAAARAAGYSNVVAPPTYPIAFMAESMDPDLFFALNLDITTVVHGEQEFEHHRPLVGGERLTVRARLSDAWEKPGRSGMLTFVVFEASAFGAGGEPVYTSRITLIARQQAEEAAS